MYRYLNTTRITHNIQHVQWSTWILATCSIYHSWTLSLLDSRPLWLYVCWNYMSLYRAYVFVLGATIYERRGLDMVNYSSLWAQLTNTSWAFCEHGITWTTRSESTVGLLWWFPLPDAFMQKAGENLPFHHLSCDIWRSCSIDVVPWGLRRDKESKRADC